MNGHLRLEAFNACQAIRVEIACQQHQLKEQHGGRPDGSSPSEEWQDHLPDHGLEAEEQKRAEQQGGGQKQSQVERHTQHAASLTACRKYRRKPTRPVVAISKDYASADARASSAMACAAMMPIVNASDTPAKTNRG